MRCNGAAENAVWRREVFSGGPLIATVRRVSSTSQPVLEYWSSGRQRLSPLMATRSVTAEAHRMLECPQYVAGGQMGR